MLACINSSDMGSSSILEYYFNTKFLLYLIYLKSVPNPQSVLYQYLMKKFPDCVLQNINTIL